MGIFLFFLHSVFVLSVIPLKIPHLWFKNTFDQKTHCSLHRSPLLEAKFYLVLGTVEDFSGFFPFVLLKAGWHVRHSGHGIG